MLNYNVIEVATLIYILTAAIKPFEIIAMTDQFITQIPIKSVTDLTLKQLLLTCIFTLQFIVLYCFFFGHILNSLIQRWKKASNDPKELLLLKKQEKKVSHASIIQLFTDENITPLTALEPAQEKQEIPNSSIPKASPQQPPSTSLPSHKESNVSTYKKPKIIHNTFKPIQTSQLLHYAMTEKMQLPEITTDASKKTKVNGPYPSLSMSQSPSFMAMMAPLSHPVPEIELFLSRSTDHTTTSSGSSDTLIADILLPPLSPPRSGSLSPSSSVTSSETTLHTPLKSRLQSVIQKAVRTPVDGESRLNRLASLRRDNKQKQESLLDASIKPSLSTKLQSKLKKSTKGFSKIFQ